MNTLSVLGLDQLLLDADDHVEIARMIRNLLAEASGHPYPLYPEPAIYSPVDARLEENRHPQMYFATGKIIELPDLFGDRLERKRRHLFQAGFNITRG